VPGAAQLKAAETVVAAVPTFWIEIPVRPAKSSLNSGTAIFEVVEVALKQEYEAIRTQGYSLDVEESVLEGCCFGAAVTAADGMAIAALSLSLPKMRLRDKAMQKQIIAAVRDAARQTSQALTPG
jgi:DNA-binding IclR family transcriptional regulator